MALKSTHSKTHPRLQAWQQFLQYVDRHAQSFWLFRGVADRDTHILKPKIGWVSHRYDLEKERIIFANFCRRARQFVDIGRYTDWDRLALA
jgi:hypothetical protein